MSPERQGRPCSPGPGGGRKAEEESIMAYRNRAEARAAREARRRKTGAAGSGKIAEGAAPAAGDAPEENSTEKRTTGRGAGKAKGEKNAGKAGE